MKYLENHGVHIEYGMDVKNVVIETRGNKKIARQIVYKKDGIEQSIDLIEDDLVLLPMDVVRILPVMEIRHTFRIYQM